MKRTRVAEASTHPPVLSAGVVGVLLAGWEKSNLAGDDQLFDLFMRRDTGVVALWRQHESFLRGEARRLGIEPDFEMPDSRVLFFGEFLSRPPDEQTAYWQRRSKEALTDEDP